MRSIGTRTRGSSLATLLRRLSMSCVRQAWITLSISTVVTGLLGAYAFTHIRFNADPNSFFSADLRFQKAIVEFEKYFPVLTNSLLIVLDGDTPERTREAADLLMPALAAQGEIFTRVFQPGEDRFFERHGLLYGSVEELERFSDRMARAQPVLSALAAEPTLPILSRTIETGLEAVGDGHTSAEGWDLVLDHFRAAIPTGSGTVSSPSWESMLVSGTGFEPSTRTVVVADPVLDLDRILAAEAAISMVRVKARELGLTPERGVLLRITGYPALNHEEMLGLATDTAVAGLLSLALVVGILLAAFRSARLVCCAAITLAVGLVAAAAFSAFFIKELNPISITFSVLVIGLGIDFMIHLGMHFVEKAVGGSSMTDSIDGAVGSTGRALCICGATTAVGFLAFVPTDFRGVSDLGLAAAGGMGAILFLSLTLFPALIALAMKDEPLARLARRGLARGIHIPAATHPRRVVAVAFVLGLLAVPVLPWAELDTNVISFRNPSTESVVAFKDLLTSRDTTPWYLDALVPNLEEALPLAEEMRALPTVAEVRTLADFVPEDQDVKLEILADVALMLGLPHAEPRRPAAAQDQWRALLDLRDYLATEPNAPTLSEPIRRLRAALDEFIAAVSAADDPRVAALASALLDPMPAQITRLTASLEVGRISLADLPSGLVERMQSEDGHARIQAFPAENIWNAEAMTAFVESIRPIWSDITGLPVNLVESARASWSSLREAMFWALAAITLLLAALWRSFRNTALCVVPLLLAVAVTQMMTVILPVPLNFANVIVLPLLLGIGVDGAIHLVERVEQLPGRTQSLLETTTARAVVFSALTTAASFGTLMISSHPGLSNLGVLLLLGMAWTVAANLVLLPALLAISDEVRARGSAKR